MAEQNGNAREKKLADAEAAALSGKPPPQPKEAPKKTPSLMDTVLGAFGVKHNVNGKEAKKAPYE